MTTIDELLDLAPGIGQRAEGFQFIVTDRNRVPKGELHPTLDHAPTITNDTSRTTSMRTLSNLEIPKADLSQIDPTTDRLAVSMLFSVGSPFPLGIFMFGDDTRELDADGSFTWLPSLFDERFILDQPLERSVTLRPGASTLALFRQLLTEVGISAEHIQVADVYPTSPATWKVGTSRLDVLEALALLLGCFPPYFDNLGLPQLRPAPLDPAVAEIDHVYAPGDTGRIVQQTPRTTSDGWRIPNRYLVIGNNPKAEVSGFYDLPASAPQSAARRGYVVTDSRTVQGVSTNAAAKQMARTIALQDDKTYEEASFVSPADPRHDTFGVVEFYGTLYLEKAWTLVCQAGGAHTHNLARLWD